MFTHLYRFHFFPVGGKFALFFWMMSLYWRYLGEETKTGQSADDAVSLWRARLVTFGLKHRDKGRLVIVCYKHPVQTVPLVLHCIRVLWQQQQVLTNNLRQYPFRLLPSTSVRTNENVSLQRNTARCAVSTSRLAPRRAWETARAQLHDSNISKISPKPVLRNRESGNLSFFFTSTTTCS